MARYRKIEVRIWNDEKFRGLSDRGKLAFLFLLTHPHMTGLGAMRTTVAGLAAELGWSEKGFREAFGEALSKGIAKHDERACFLCLPNFLKHNPPESPNVVKSWRDQVDLIPECSAKDELLQQVKGFVEGLGEAFAKALPIPFAKGMPYQEQEQEQEQEQDKPPLPPKGEESRRIRLPDVLQTDEFKKAWSDWVQFRREKKKPLTPQMVEKQIASFAEWGPGRAIAAINFTILKGWQGLQEPPNDDDSRRTGITRPSNGRSGSPNLLEREQQREAQQLDILRQFVEGDGFEGGAM